MLVEKEYIQIENQDNFYKAIDKLIKFMVLSPMFKGIKVWWVY